MLQTTIGAICLSIAMAGSLAAQAERWQVTLGENQYVWDVQLGGLDGDSLVVTQADSLLRVAVDHITELRLIQKTEMQPGGGDTDETMTALTGGDDEFYDLSALDLADRLRTIQKILRFHPTGP